MRDIFAAVAFGLMLTLLVFTLVCALAVAYNSVSCDDRWPDHEARYELLSGCMVQTDEGWVPSRNVRVVLP